MSLKLFRSKQVRQAIQYARDGGQALHIFGYRGKNNAAHLIDHDRERLMLLAEELGVKRIQVDREGIDGQHVNLWGIPLRQARKLVDTDGEQDGS